MGKIVITGYGVKAPGITNIQEFRTSLENGICSMSVLRGKGPNDADIVAGVIQDELLTINGKNFKRYPRVSRLSISAVDDAMEMAQLGEMDPTRMSVVLGTSTGGIKEIQENSKIADDFRRYPIHGLNLADPHTVTSAVASHPGIKGQVLTITTGCAASSDAISLGKLLLESRQTDICIVGGADSTIEQWSIWGFSKLRQIALNKSIGETGVPFSDNHSGFDMAEGAGILVLERESDAIERDATIYGVLEGIHSNNDGLGMFQSDETGYTMLKALKSAINGHMPTYVNSQSLGLKSNDTIESIVHQRLFGQAVPITSIKGIFGHAFGAMGAIQVVSALLSIEHDFIPLTLHTQGKGFEALPIVFETKYVPVNKVAITTHGNSGNNTCLLVSKY
ncbi:beta-ketoacyl synthase N-terminal-like domain-containing protein [Sporosarcina sp. CAU 1771]